MDIDRRNVDTREELEKYADDREFEANFNPVTALQELIEELRSSLNEIQKELTITRATNKLINDTINSHLMQMIKEYKPEGNCCFLVKNVSDVCFVHKIDERERTFENIELAKVPQDIKEGDVLVLKNGNYEVSLFVTADVLRLKYRILKSLANSIDEFQVEGETYTVCDKSDDVKEAKMSLKNEENGKEFWGIEIDEELYKEIGYGSIVKYQKGRYIVM